MSNEMSPIYDKMPELIREQLQILPCEIINSIEEIRLRINTPVLVRTGNREITLDINSDRITSSLLDTVMNNLMDYSVYAYENEIANGYITIKGGHRVGICGRVVQNQSNITLIKDISSINIRRGKEIKGTGERIINKLYDTETGLQNTLIVSPPKCGKTTLLRDIVRIISHNGLRVGVCDERSEIAGMYQGKPAYDIGPRTDVLDGCPKAEGMRMLIRSMAPDVVVTDEIGKNEDIDALEDALCAGVKIITTIHGRTFEDLLSSKLASLVSEKVFTRIIFLTNIPSTGTVREVRYV